MLYLKRQSESSRKRQLSLHRPECSDRHAPRHPPSPHSPLSPPHFPIGACAAVLCVCVFVGGSPSSPVSLPSPATNRLPGRITLLPPVPELCLYRYRHISNPDSQTPAIATATNIRVPSTSSYHNIRHSNISYTDYRPWPILPPLRGGPLRFPMCNPLRESL